MKCKDNNNKKGGKKCILIFFKSVDLLLVATIKVNCLKPWHSAKETSIVRWSTELMKVTELTV